MKQSYSIRIKAYRERHNMTQKEFANLMHVGIATVIRWEKNEFEPTLKIRAALDEVLNKDFENEIVFEGYEDPKDQFNFLINDCGFDEFFIYEYLRLDPSELRIIHGSKEGLIDNARAAVIKDRLYQLYIHTFDLDDYFMISLVNTYKDKYDLSDKALATLAGCREQDIISMCGKEIKYVPTEFKYKLAVKLFSLSHFLPKKY